MVPESREATGLNSECDTVLHDHTTRGEIDESRNTCRAVRMMVTRNLAAERAD
jgi:hypothetical protein